MTSFFDQAFYYLLQNEGTQFTNDPDDTGGPTRYGVTLKTYAAFVGREVTEDEIRKLTVEKAQEFYRKTFWSWLKCEKLWTLEIAVCLFDSGVLHGPGIASVTAQRAATACGYPLKFDGVLGEESIAALNTVEKEPFLKAYRDQLLARIDSVIKLQPTKEKYRKGWTARADRLLTLTGTAPLM